VGHNRARKGFDDPRQSRYLFFDRHIYIMPSVHRASLMRHLVPGDILRNKQCVLILSGLCGD
jgi:hypothetical protein